MEPVGALLAGGLGRRMGGDKATVALDGVPLIRWPLAALRAVLRDVVVVAKRDTVLPPLDGADVWVEPDDPRHPLCGVVHALRLAQGRPALVVAADLPLLDVPTLRAVLDADRGGVRAVVARAGGRLQPLCGLYLPQALEGLEPIDPEVRLTDAVRALGVREVEVDDEALLNVNAPEDVWHASGLVARRGVAAPTTGPAEDAAPPPRTS